MALAFCPECFCWTFPVNERCPECHHNLTLEGNEPSADALRAAMGELVARVGEVQVNRTVLPDSGTLYATSTGFLFVPHRLDHVTRLVNVPSGKNSLALTIAALIWSPLGLVLPLLQTKQKQETQVPVLRPIFLAPSESHVLPELLLTKPGVFFIRKRAIRVLRRKRKRWSLDRLQGSRVTLRPTSDPARFHRRMEDLLALPDWQDVTVT